MSKKVKGKGIALVPSERIESRIYLIRGKRVSLDSIFDVVLGA